MEDLRLKAQELIKVKRSKKKELNSAENIVKENDMNNRKEESKKVFIEKIQKEIDEFQKRLLESANNGEPLRINILRLDTEGLLSWWDEREDKFVNTIYTPIKSEVVTFIDDMDLELLGEEIIVDDTLKKLYNLIKDNDIYPQWKISQRNGKIETLYIEADPSVSYKEKKEAINREKNIKQRALVVQNYRQNVIEQDRGIMDRIKKFLLIFIPTLYLSVMILTILSSALGLVDVSNSSASFSFLEIGWPYFLVSSFDKVGEMFIFSLPLGMLISLYFAYKKS